MRIAQIAPGAPQRVVSYLTEELARLGHQVTLFASEVRAQAHEFDVLHFHVEHAPLQPFRPLAHKTLTTLYGRLDLPELAPLYRELADMPLVSTYDGQRGPLAFAHWAGTVYPGLAREVCPFNPAPRGDYYAFLGPVSPAQGLELATDIARRAGVRVRIAAKLDGVEVPGIEFIGEVDEAGKPAFLGNAKALLFPVDPPDAFGLAMIEALSCGTPVVAWPHGAAAEVVEHGVTGFVVQSADAAAEALGRAARLDRSRVRRRFEERFSATRMAQDYLAVYRALARRRALAAA